MKYYKYWAKERYHIQIDGEEKEITLVVGSCVSLDDAQNKGTLRAQQIEQRIAGQDNQIEYEAGIKEFVAEIIDEANIVTVCRYGARVLNTNEYTILDLDDYAKSVWDIFKPLKHLTKKQRIIYKFERFLDKHPDLGLDFRIYETSKGIRVIGKKYLDPNNEKYKKLLSKLNVDWLYLVLSQKQQCYRARLTPKPYRLGITTMRVRSPLTCNTDEYKDWAAMYDAASRNYSVVKFIKSIGRDFSSNRVIQHHDKQCRSQGLYDLA